MPINYNQTPHGDTNETAIEFRETEPGHPEYLMGPLSDLNAIPYRGGGSVAHGIDTDLVQSDWLDHPDPEDTDGLMADGEMWNAPEPLIVSVVEQPVETEERHSRIISLFGSREFYTFTTVGNFDTYPPRMLLPKDDTRTRVTILALPTPELAVATGNGAQYGFLISNEQSCNTGILLGIGGAAAPSEITLFGKSAVYGRLVPLAAYDAAKANNYSLCAVSDTSVLGSHKVR